MLSWIPPSVHQWNGIIRHYIVNINETNTGRNFSRQTSTHTMFVVGDLHPFYTYQFSLQAVTIAAGPFSPIINITMQEDGEELCNILLNVKVVNSMCSFSHIQFQVVLLEI